MSLLGIPRLTVGQKHCSLNYNTTPLHHTMVRHRRMKKDLRHSDGSVNYKRNHCSANDTEYSVRIPNGVYLRDDGASTMKNYSRMLGLLQLSGIQRLTAIQLIEGVDVRVDEGKNTATVKYLTVVPFYNVVEEYRLDGTRTKNGRRDLQPGSMVCRAGLKNDLPKESREGQNMVLRLDMYWENPNAGALLEEMHVVQGGRELVVRSTVKVESGTETARMVYRKIDGEYVPKYQWNPLEAFRLMNRNDFTMDVS